MSSHNFCICGHHKDYHWWWKTNEQDRASMRIVDSKCFGGSKSDNEFFERNMEEFKENSDGFINCGYQIDVNEHETKCRCRLFEDCYLPMHMTG
jgi:hypothetical protein